MNNEKKSIKIALLNKCDPQDKRSWSGLIYYIAQALQKHCGDVSYLGPIDATLERLIGQIFNKSSQIFLKKNFAYEHCFLIAQRFARVAAQRLAQQPFDLIVAPASATEVALLETDIPIVLIEDSTYGSLYDYYPNFTHFLKISASQVQTIQNLALKKASAVIYSSAWAARSALENYATDPGKVHVVPFGANLDENPPRELALERKKTDRCRLLFLGVEWQRKGGDIAFETLLKLEEMGIAAELIVCGCRPPKKFAHERMTVIPFLNKNDARQRRELEKLLLGSDFLLLPTRAEAYGLVFCEANAFGLPVIATDTGGVREIIRDGENGFLLPYSEGGAAYAEVIANLYCDDERYAQLVRASRAAFEDRLNWDAWGTAVKKILTQLLDHENSHADSHMSTDCV